MTTLPRPPDTQAPAQPDATGALEWSSGPKDAHAGGSPGAIRVARYRGFRRLRPWRFVAEPAVDEPTSGLGRALLRLKHALLGPPIPSERESVERLGKAKALAVFSSDALSSVAYATEEIMKVLILGSAALLTLTLPIALAIVVLLGVVVLSYRQTIRAYPTGGGSYIVASQNLGRLPGLTAAASLLIDYVLTVAVSVSAGVAALTSWLPPLGPYTVQLAVAAVMLIGVANLRGVRDSGAIFAVPTYLFVGTVFLLIGAGVVRLALGGVAYNPPPSALPPRGEPLTLFLLLSAFAQGCTAMTGTEAISNGVRAFKPPEARNAGITLVWMGLLLGAMFVGLSYLAAAIGVVPAADETVLSQVGRMVFGAGPLWAVLQVATALILVLAANTAFADFPRLASILATDHYLPRAFQFRGDRLAFSSGIVALTLLACGLLIATRGELDALIPLYAVGVFTSFTLSQAGMVRHGWREGGPGWRRSAAINGLGALATGVVTAVIVATKFLHGAWLVVVLIPVVILGLRTVSRHYERLDRAQTPEIPTDPAAIRVRAVVPLVSARGVGPRQALAYARAIAPDPGHVVAVHVAMAEDDAAVFRRDWAALGLDAQLVIIESPFRSLVGPLVAFVDDLKQLHPRDTITVVLPVTIPARWWERLLHDQSALWLRASLAYRPGIVVVAVPHHVPADA